MYMILIMAHADLCVRNLCVRKEKTSRLSLLYAKIIEVSFSVSSFQSHFISQRSIIVKISSQFTLQHTVHGDVNGGTEPVLSICSQTVVSSV